MLKKICIFTYNFLILKHWFIIFCFLVSTQVFAQNTCIIKVFITNKQTATVLSGATVYAVKTNQNYISNDKGIAECTVACDSDSLYISYLGYRDTTILIGEPIRTYISIALTPSEFAIEKVTITKQPIDENLTNTIGEIQLQRSELRNLPSFMGEPDVLRTISTRGGVMQIEGMQGIFVRGGSQDQNLILYDGATVFNPSHLLGFFSVFNSDIVQSASLFSSGAPAMYGGRLSSVLSIQSLQAKPDSIEASVNFGVLSSRSMINVPITKHSAVRVSFRKTYLNLFVMPLVEQSLQLNDEVHTEFGFYDATFRYDYKPNSQNSFSISTYVGKDNFRLVNSKISLQNHALWGNAIIAGQWKHLSSNNWVHTITASFSNYSFNFLAQQSLYSLEISTGVSKYAIQYIAKKRYEFHTLQYGIATDFQIYNSGTFDVKIDDTPFNTYPALVSQSTEQSIFIEDQWNITQAITSNISLRAVPYFLLGPSEYIVYNEAGESKDTIVYKKNEIMYSKFGIEPRIEIKYQLSSESSLKASCMRTTQNMHMVSMLSAALPADIWLPASYYTPRMYGWISSIGYYRDFNNSMYQTSASIYYKTMHNMTEFKDGFITLYANSYNQKITTGKGYAFGSEFSIKKTSGDLQGGVTYNLSRSLRKFTELNQGYLYPASYDKPHDVAIHMQYRINKSLTLSGLWVYSSGKVYSEPVSKYFIGKNVVSEYGALNSSRMPAYHRLDLSAEYILKKTKLYELTTQVSVYNAYNRNNIYYIYYETQGNIDEFSIQFVKNYVGLFPILPSLSIQLNL